eukprot:902187-Amphidinium_carterae.1
MHRIVPSLSESTALRYLNYHGLSVLSDGGNLSDSDSLIRVVTKVVKSTCTSAISQAPLCFAMPHQAEAAPQLTTMQVQCVNVYNCKPFEHHAT